jgi:four helix bundle protein
MNMEKKIRSFADLVAWQEGHKLVLIVYRKTKDFPREEVFGLISQMRRCAVSITSNIAEGFSRKTVKDKQYFYYISLGSITELQNQLAIVRDLGYLNAEDFSQISCQTINVHKLVNGLIKSSAMLHT